MKGEILKKYTFTSIFSNYELTSLHYKSTNVNNYIFWAVTKYFREKNSIMHIKIENKYKQIASFSITNKPKLIQKSKEMILTEVDLKNIKSFIIKNKETLIKHWDGEYDSGDLVNNIKKI
jgi:hypothetical protein